MKNLPTDKIISCFYDSSGDCVKVINTDGILMSFNPNGLKIMEIDDERDVIGKQWLAFWKGNLQTKATTALQRAKEGKVAKFEGYCPTFKGTMKYWEVAIAPLHDDFGNIQWLLITSRDATAQRALEKEVADQRIRIETLEQQLQTHPHSSMS
jgi:PAS domain S-box-containing protein